MPTLKDKRTLPQTITRPLQDPTCQIRRRSDLYLLFLGICIASLAIGHIFMHNPHVPHLELRKAGGVHGSLERFVVEGKKRWRGKANKGEEVKGESEKVGSEESVDEAAASEVEKVQKELDQFPDEDASDVETIKQAIQENPHESVIVQNDRVALVDKEDSNAANVAEAITPQPTTKPSTNQDKKEDSNAENVAVAISSQPTTKPSTNPIKSPTKTTSNQNSIAKEVNQNTHKIINPSDSIHPVAHLSCTDHGGPSNSQVIDEMVFWSDIPSDASYISPMYGEGNEKYLTFEPDHGGWNNIRMAMETALVMSHAMGRTLVLPPEQGMYLIDKKSEGQKSQFSFNDFFHLDAIAMEHKGFKVITTEEFLKREALTGGLQDYFAHVVKYPPENRTDWNGQNREPLFQYLRSVANTPSWDPWECALAIPSDKSQSSIDELNTTLHSIMDGTYGKPKPKLEEFNGNPTAVDAPLGDRMREMLADRENLCIYDKALQEEKVIHLKVQGGVRLLTHFYAFIFFADWRQDLWSKRFVRDHLRYVDDIVCAAARVLEAVREHARKNEKHKPSKEEGIYDAMHVRRGDFQYTPTRLPANELYELSKNEFTEGATLYVATDERNKTFFDIFKEKYDVVFLDDFMHVIPDVNTNYYGMIDQLVSYKSRVFYGTWWSTLSGYVNRMRGYYITKHKLEGWEDGTMQSWYFTPEERRLQMRSYIPVRKPIYCKEFAVAWRDIDKGIGE